MAEKQDAKKSGKKTIKSILMIALIPLMIIVLIASAFFAIIDGIIGIITGVVKAITNLFDGDWWAKQWNNIKSGTANLGNGWSKLWGLESFNEGEYNKFALKPIYTISQSEFESIATSIENAVNRKATGLDNIIIKKMLLAYYKTTMLSGYEVRIQIDPKKDVEEGKKLDDYNFEPFEKKEIDGGIYLVTQGSISVCVDIIDEKGNVIKEDEELRCFEEEGIKKIYEKEYKDNLENNYKYAQAVKKSLQYIYTIDEKGCVKMLSINTKDTGKEYKYSNENIKSVNKSIDSVSYEWITLDFTNKVSQYATPMEFLVNIMQITGSKEFVEDVIKLVDSNTRIKLKIYSTEKKTEERISQEYEQKMEVIGKKEVEYSAKRTDDTSDGIVWKKEEIPNDPDNVWLIIEDTLEKGLNINLYRNGKPDMQLYGYTRTGTRFEIDESQKGKYAYSREENKEYKLDNNILRLKINKDTHEEIAKNDEGKVVYTETSTQRENSYEIMIKEVNNWYATIKYEGNAINTNKTLYTINQDGNQIPINEEKEAVTINIEDQNKSYNKADESQKKYFENNNQYNVESKNGEEGFINNIYNYTVRKEEADYDYSKLNYDIINTNKTNTNKNSLIINTTSLTYSGSQKVIDKTDNFVELLRKEYKDNYKGKVKPGELLINADEMLFQLLDTSYKSSDGKEVCNTVGLSNVMRWILQKYSDKNYGILDFNQIANMYNNMSIIGQDYSVITDNLSSELLLDKQTILDTIDKTKYSEGTKKNLKSAIDGFMYIQNNNKVNAVFAIATTIVESTGGTNWGAIDSSTYNWMSVTGSYNNKTYRNPNSSNPRTWRVYSSFNEATKDFGDIMENGPYYFKSGKTTVKAIAPTYCSEQWGTSIISVMADFYKKAGVSIGAFSNGDFLSIAKSCHDYLKENNYYYSSAKNKNAGKYIEDGTSTGSKVPKPYNGEGNYIDCSAYVCWVLYEYGYSEFGGYQKSSTWFANPNNWKNYGWKEIPISQAKAGDIVASNAHVEIYCGDGKFLNCGSTKAIRNECDNYADPIKALNRFTIAIRIHD